MMSCERAPNYALQTLSTLFGDPAVELADVHVVVDGMSDHYLGNWASDTRVTTHLLDAQTGASLVGADVARRIGETFYRALAVAPEGSDALICQDDISFGPGWLQKTLAAVGHAERMRANRSQKQHYVITLYATKRLRAAERPLALYKPAHFFGNQALYFPADTMARLVPYVAKHRVSGMMDDMLLKRFMMEEGTVLRILNPNPVQHIGGVGTHDGRFHSSPTFGKA